jgi:hypothetical protein
MFTRRSFVSCALVSLCACGAGEAIRPQDPTYAGASGGDTLAHGPGCHDVGSDGSPLIVDWKPEERGDLEVAMRQGVAVVHYDCNSFRLLADCHPRGTYGFVGITKKEQIISLANADEAKANLPLNGGTLGASLSRGSTLDIALVMVGKQATTFSGLTRDDLVVGSCDGATHFVHGATVGAFAMKTGTAGEVQSTASLFGVGANAGSSSHRSVSNKDGDSEACSQADLDAKKPPAQCGALLRIQLVAISDGAKTDAKVGPPATGDAGAPDKGRAGVKAPPSDLSCPDGLVAVQGKCAAVAQAANMPHECKYGDPKDCAVQCDAGELTSCARLGFMYTDMTGFVHYDEAKSLALFQRACGGGNQAGCSGLGEAYELALGVVEDDAKPRCSSRAPALRATPTAATTSETSTNLAAESPRTRRAA